MIPCYILTSIKDADHEEHVHGQQDQEPPLLEATGAFRGPVAETPIRGKNIYEYPAPISLMNPLDFELIYSHEQTRSYNKTISVAPEEG